MLWGFLLVGLGRDQRVECTEPLSLPCGGGEVVSETPSSQVHQIKKVLYIVVKRITLITRLLKLILQKESFNFQSPV